MTTNPDVGRYGSGQVVRRIGPALLAGRGQYAGDVSPGQAWLVFIRSPFAHAKINGIDVSAAKAIAGVLDVITGEQMANAGVKAMTGAAGFKRADGSPVTSSPRRALAHEVARFMGEGVALVVAETQAAAREAADAVIVDYEELPAVVDTLAALKSGAPVLCVQAPDNIAAEARYGDSKAVAAAFASAAHTVSLDIENQRLAANPIEPRTVLPPSKAMGQLWVGFPARCRRPCVVGSARLFPAHTAEHACGRRRWGGFGMKTGLYRDVAVATRPQYDL